MRLSRCLNVIFSMQNWIEDKLRHDGDYKSPLVRNWFDLYLNTKYLNNIVSNITAQTNFLVNQAQYSLLNKLSEMAMLHHSTLNQIQDTTKAQNSILDQIRGLHKTQDEMAKLQEASNRWAGRFGMVAAVIAVALSTAALFAGLAAIPVRQAGSFEVDAPLNVALTIVAVSTAVAFTLIVIREGYEVLKKLPMVWLSGGSILAACLLGLFGRWIPFFHGWVSASVLGVLLLIATVAATLFLSEIERTLGGANTSLEEAEPAPQKIESTADGSEHRTPLKRRPRARS